MLVQDDDSSSSPLQIVTTTVSECHSAGPVSRGRQTHQWFAIATRNGDIGAKPREVCLDGVFFFFCSWFVVSCTAYKRPAPVSDVHGGALREEVNIPRLRTAPHRRRPQVERIER